MSEHGVRGLYQGLGPNLLRASLVNVGELSAYDSAKQVRARLHQYKALGHIRDIH